MPTSSIPKPHVFCPFSRRSHTQLGIVHKAAYDLVLAPYGAPREPS
jgi:hypothetical protein